MVICTLSMCRLYQPASISGLAKRKYVLVDDKLRILTAVKKAWGARLTTVFPRQGPYANDPKALATYPPADITIEGSGDLLRYDLPMLLPPDRGGRIEIASDPTAISRWENEGGRR